MTDRDRQLIIDNIKICYYFFQRYSIHDEDAQQYLMIRLCEQIHKYNPERGSLSTFFFTVLKTGYLSYLKENSRFKRVINTQAISLESPLLLDRNAT